MWLVASRAEPGGSPSATGAAAGRAAVTSHASSADSAAAASSDKASVSNSCGGSPSRIAAACPPCRARVTLRTTRPPAGAEARRLAYFSAKDAK
ncbi:hypothetical protein GCM10023084_45420 [Streptomyces lacrimifluminis]|uniref:Uncharacterized protein n=1 Tax=Streptomyces lacrimifluminis TaxID=1500077 RepID=A0A917L815_9ACTN|nr:hypothetical protein GCM10012282_47420 [Streptomyces lacrimifluminis]